MSNLSRNCYGQRRLEQGERLVSGVEWKEMIKQKAFGGKLLAAFKTLKKAWARTVLEEAARVTQLGTDGSWQKESPSKEEPELFRNVL